MESNRNTMQAPATTLRRRSRPHAQPTRPRKRGTKPRNTLGKYGLLDVPTASNRVTKKLRRRLQQDCGEAQSEAPHDHKSEQEPRAGGTARRRRLDEPVYAVDRAQANRGEESERFAP